VDLDVTFIRYRYEWPRTEPYSVDTHLYSNPYRTLTERYGEGSTYKPPAEPDEQPTAPELDLSTVPDWYAWF
jgi:hypothetical protein